MVYLVGGYILTFEQVLAFTDHNKFEEPCIDAIAFVVVSSHSCLVRIISV